MRHTFSGMSLIELLATIAILGVISILAIPSFRALQGRQDLRVTQASIQSALYRLQQLAVAPPALAQDNGQSTDFDIVGYGLAFFALPKSSYSGALTVGNCRVVANNDFLAVYKFVRFKRDNSDIQPYLMPVDPSATGTCQLTARTYPQDIYVLPSRVSFATRASSPVLTQPWLITQPLQSVGTSVGTLAGGVGFVDPFVSTTTPLIAVQHKNIKKAGQPLCYGVSLSRYSDAVQMTNQVTQGCSND